jgi:hypothetical protein
VPRLAYLEGVLEIMTPSRSHGPHFPDTQAGVDVEREGRLSVHVLRGQGYEEVAQSEVLAGIDLAYLATFLDRPTASRAIREYRAGLKQR